MAFAFFPDRDAARPRASAAELSGLFRDADYQQQRSFFAGRPELTPTPLRRLPGLARSLGLADLRVKDETQRFGLNAFKAAGAIFAIATLRARGRIGEHDTLVCASEGNHGRAVARAARDLGLAARVYMSASVAPARSRAIEDEGATVVRVAGTYDDAVRRMTADAQQQRWTVISDTSLDDDDETTPRLIMLGYTRLMDEAEAQWGPAPPDLLLVPGGVGGLLAAVASWVASRFGPGGPRVVAVEPADAACLLVSVRAGRPTTLSGPFETAMAGLRCGEVSRAAFSAVASAVHVFVAIEDRWAVDAMRRLARPAGRDPAIRTGASGAAALGGLLAVLFEPELAAVKVALGLTRGARVMVFATEGVTDPDYFSEAVPELGGGVPKADK